MNFEEIIDFKQRGKLFGLGMPQKIEDLTRFLKLKSKTKVFGIGLQKTGTSTLARCMQLLGLRHMGYRPDLLEEYLNDSHYEKTLNIAKYYDAFEDWPWFLLYKQLDEQFPNSKFILTVRQDAQTWINSYSNWEKKRGPEPGRAEFFGASTSIGNEKLFVETYKKWNQNVFQYFQHRPDDLLVICWENGDGWEKLCNFLGVNVPDMPFPHKNKTKKE